VQHNIHTPIRWGRDCVQRYPRRSAIIMLWSISSPVRKVHLGFDSIRKLAAGLHSTTCCDPGPSRATNTKLRKSTRNCFYEPRLRPYAAGSRPVTIRSTFGWAIEASLPTSGLYVDTIINMLDMPHPPFAPLCYQCLGSAALYIPQVSSDDLRIHKETYLRRKLNEL